MRNVLRLLPALALVLFVAACGGGDDDYADRMAEEHADDSTGATPMVMEPMMAVDVETVTYMDGVTGFLATPQRPDSVAAAMGLAADAPLPAVVLVHEWWGLNDNIEAMARRLAGEGFRVLAVDLYGGEVADTPDRAQALMGQASDDRDAMMANLGAAMDFLGARYGAEEIGVMGWCFGGGVSLQTALAHPDRVDAAVIYYGHVGDVAADADRLGTLDMPIIGFFGGQDTGIPVADVRTLEQTLRQVDADAEIFVYDDAGHAFANPTGNNYVESAATDAWDKTTEFLRRALYGASAVGTDMDA